MLAVNPHTHAFGKARRNQTRMVSPAAWQYSCKANDMITGRRASDWLRAPSQDESQGEEERCGSDRRATDRRAPRREIDPLFAATLLRHLAPPAAYYVDGYRTPTPTIRRGGVVNRWA
jgi:hypothetical protein